MPTYKVFVRNWYKYERVSKGKREIVPNPTARKTVIATVYSEAEARDRCRKFNEANDPGPLSRKAEYTSNY
jgi:hypothetical protein